MATMWREFSASVCAERNEMKRLYAKAAIIGVVALGGWASGAPAHAVPPTVTPSPGYDARLQQQRAALNVAVVPETAYQRRLRRLHQRALKHR
jgi:hypothetical protein